MTWTYSGNPSDSKLDELRFWTQDVKPDEPLLTDEEFGYLLDRWWVKTGSILFTAAVACEAIAAKFAGEVDVSADGVSVGMSQLQERYLRLAARLREQHRAEAAAGATPITSGIMWDETHDPTIKPLRFGVGHMDNYEAGRQDYGDFDPGSRPYASWPFDEVPDYLKVGP